jgi:hypothetical protein
MSETKGPRVYNNNPYDKNRIQDAMNVISIGFRKTVHTAMRAGFEYDIAESLRQELAKMEEADRFSNRFPRFSDKKRIAILNLIAALAAYKKHV